MFSVMTAGAAPAFVGKGAAVAEAATAWTTTDIRPRRFGTSFRIAAEDAVNFEGLEAQVRADMGMALADTITERILNANETGGNSSDFKGFASALGAPSDPVSSVFTYADIQDKAFGEIDGLWAADLMEVRFLAKPSILKHLRQKYRLADTVGESDNALAFINRETGGLRTNQHVASTTANQEAFYSIRTGGMGITAVHGLWNSVMLTDDYTGAQKGERVVVANAMHGFAVIRADAYERRRIKTA